MPVYRLVKMARIRRNLPRAGNPPVKHFRSAKNNASIAPFSPVKN
jgi:hypothetical protein